LPARTKGLFAKATTVVVEMSQGRRGSCTTLERRGRPRSRNERGRSGSLL